MRSINQVRHFYVATGAGSVNTKSAVGTLETKLYDDNSSLMFKYMTPGGPASSDKIDVDKIMYAKYTSASAMAPKFNTVTLTVGNAVVGQEYVVKVMINNYAGAGDDNYTVKYGMYTAKSGDNVAAIAKGLRDSLKANMKDLVVLPAVGGEGAVITITEAADDYKVGVKPFRIVRVTKDDVTLFPIEVDSIETTEWASKEETAATGDLNNGPIIADMEWFYVGARGDMYRGFGHPHGVKTELVADGKTAYDTLDIHYAYVGPNEGAQKSEKTITIAGSDTILKSINNALATLKVPGVTTID